MNSHSQLIFVYNTDSGLWNWVTDYARKAIDPDSYSCNLCKIIAGNGLTIKKPWKEFIQSLNIPTKFMYLDEFKTLFPTLQTSAPAIFWIQQTQIPKLIVTSKDINAVADLEGLIELVKARILASGVGGEVTLS